MRKNDAAYLAAVAVLTAVMLALLLWPGEGGGGTASLWATPPPGAGTPRDIDPAQFRELIRQRRLSDHEAEFYRVLDAENTPPH